MKPSTLDYRSPPSDGRRRWTLSSEAVLLLASFFWLVAANRGFLQAALKGRLSADPAAWALGGALALAVLALHFLLLALVMHRVWLKPLLALLFVVTAFATHNMQQYGVYLNPSMLRNVLRTDPAEARELFSLSLGLDLLLYAALPIALLWQVHIRPRRLLRALGLRIAAIALAFALIVAAALAVFQPLSSLMRNQKDLRYLITPANYVWSLASVVAADLRGAAKPRQAIGLDAAMGPASAARKRPQVLVLVLGETARAANWGLSGYARQTTPRLAQLPVINFSQVSSCGTDTETSVPCLFAPVGRRDYDEARIRGSESLLHVLARAGVAVHWRDNQSGCKGVCTGLSNEQVIDNPPPGLCANGRCFDEALLSGLAERLKAAHATPAAPAASTPPTAGGTQLLVLHMLGNHGPSYFRRYPPAFARFQPACESDDLHACSREQIVNAYDNALLYTDEVLARLIEQLGASGVDSAMVYVSDHGESLGENNLFLHGMPHAIAPKEQTQVPLVMWMSPGFQTSAGLDVNCLKARATQPASHDHLFHTLLTLLDVRTALFDPAWDLTQGCKKP